MQKKKRSESESAELRYRGILDKRDEFNNIAVQFRDARNQLNDQRHERLDELRKMKEERGAVVKKLREHKARRDAYQKKFKELLAYKRNKRKDIRTGLPHEIKSIKTEVEKLDMKQQTVPLPIPEENKLIDEIRLKVKGVKELEKKAAQQETIKIQVDDIDKTLTDLKEMADEEHKKVVEFSTQADELRSRQDEAFKEITHLIIEGKKNHESYLAAREKANEYHTKAMEMREKIMASKREARDEARAARREVDEANRAARRALLEPSKLDEAAEQSLKELLKKGKVEIG
ncbi:MAG: hypothetical protein HZB92_01080 [Euryarchaeota archaeon]|nr:hypothetical protein [Euryarchaeota archaeon]